MSVRNTIIHVSLCCSAELSTITMCTVSGLVSITGIYEFGYIHSSSPSHFKFSDLNRNDQL